MQARAAVRRAEEPGGNPFLRPAQKQRALYVAWMQNQNPSVVYKAWN